MVDKPKTAKVKSAYELALERLEGEGIKRPRDEAYSEETRQQMAEVRSKAEAKLAELEILYRDRLKSLRDPSQRQEEESNYGRDRRRIESDRDRQLEKLRQES